MINEKRLIDRFLQLVKIDAKSGNEKSVANFIISELNSFGMETTIDDADKKFFGNSGNVYCRIKGTDESLPAILFGSHMDTIKSTKGINAFIKDGIIQTDKTTILGADNRAGVAVILEIFNLIYENHLEHPTIQAVFSVAEEKGMYGSKNVDANKLNVDYGFIFDSSARPGKVIVSAPASREISIKITGKAAHAAVQPEKGINALDIASAALSKIKTGRVGDHETVNFGTISGGNAINVVPDNVDIAADVRAIDIIKLNNNILNIKEIFTSEARKFGGNVEFDIIKKYDSFSLNESENVVQLAFDGIRNTGLEPEAIVYSGGSDANIYNRKGIPTVNLGMGFQMVHSQNEYIPVDDLISDLEVGLGIISVAAKKYKNASLLVNTNKQ